MIYAAVSIFAIAYVFMLVFSKYRPYIALGSALIFIMCGMLSVENMIGATLAAIIPAYIYFWVIY